jgi:protein tyrosine phosphatase (PTP) superfamily phosphohydrolase (DUF442 family)
MRLLKIMLVALLAVLTSVWYVSKNNFHEVIPGQIYRSAQLGAGTLEGIITEYDIKTVLSLRRPKPEKSWYREEKQVTNALGVEHYDIAIDLAFSPRIDHLLELRDLLEGAEKPLLVHCKAGADRTGLAAIMTKLLDGSSSLEDARAQVSWKTHVVRGDSIGIGFYDQYVAWLQETGQSHSSNEFNRWLEDEYQDLSGNIHFLVDPIDRQLWERPWGLINEGYEFEIERSDSDLLELSGWAFDTHNLSLLKGVDIYLGDVLFENIDYGTHQPWLMDDFGKSQYIDSGWVAKHPIDQFGDGCHDLQLRFERNDGSSWRSPSAARICIE